MSALPESVDLVELIEEERKRALRLADEADSQLAESEQTFKEALRSMEMDDEAIEAALDVLRRAGLLRS